MPQPESTKTKEKEESNKNLLDLEPLEVRALLPDVHGGPLLSPGGSLPLGGNVGSLELLLDGRRAGGSGELSEEVRGEDEVLEGKSLSGDTGGGTVDEGLMRPGRGGREARKDRIMSVKKNDDTLSVLIHCIQRVSYRREQTKEVGNRPAKKRKAHPLVVNDLGDDGELALGGSLVDEDDSTNLDEPLEGGRSFDGL